MVKNICGLMLLCLLSTVTYASQWQCVNRAVTCNTWRMEVPAGWVVASDTPTDSHGYAMAFVPDAAHEWKL